MLRPPVLPEETPVWDGEAREAALERKFRRFGPPLALLLAKLFELSPFGHFLQRTFLSMMIHELGHAVSAWLLGYPAFPMLWVTSIAESRSWPWAACLLGAFGFLVYLGRATERRWLVALGSALLALELLGVLQPAERARALITFGGDGGALVLGTVLMLLFYVPPGSPLHRGALRWGFLVIGAASFVDVFSVWWRARKDRDEIPFGLIEGVGLSDPSKLTEDHGWPVATLVNRYVALGVVCLVVLAVAWAYFASQKSEETSS